MEGVGGDSGGDGGGKGESVREREGEGLFLGIGGLGWRNRVVSNDSIIVGEYGTPTQLSLEAYKTWENVKGWSTNARRVRRRKHATKEKKKSLSIKTAASRTVISGYQPISGNSHYSLLWATDEYKLLSLRGAESSRTLRLITLRHKAPFSGSYEVTRYPY